MHPSLDDVELRVLGVLIEKSLTQPATYPMTINAMVLGANQKQNREPVLSLSEGDVSRALQRLQHKRVVKQAPPQPGERSNKYAHAVVDVYKWDRREQAVMAELMLRGRQTPGELRGHASRMVPLNDLESVGAILAALRDAAPPVVVELPREPGRSANRWRHLLGGSDTGAPAPAPVDEGAPQRSIAEAAPSGVATISPLETRLEALESSVRELDRRLRALESASEPPT